MLDCPMFSLEIVHYSTYAGQSYVHGFVVNTIEPADKSSVN
jgi:hypothetical protein